MDRADKAFFSDLISGDADKIRTAARDYLAKHVKWYEGWSDWYSGIWNIGTLLVIVLSAATSLLTASNVSNKWLVVGLPALSALIGTLLINFRVRDMWRLREVGRIEAETLAIQAILLPTDPEQAKAKAVELFIAAHNLERAQMGEFFAEPNDKKTIDAAKVAEKLVPPKVGASDTLKPEAAKAPVTNVSAAAPAVVAPQDKTKEKDVKPIG